MPKVSLNDSIVEVPPNTTLQEALSGWNQGGSPCVIAVNREFVQNKRYADVILREGDEIDLVRPVQGG